MIALEQVVPEEYKQTEVGLIPINWSLTKLEHLTSLIIDGTHHTPTYTSFGVPFLRVTDIQGPLDDSKFKYVSEQEHKVLIKRCKPELGDLLLSKNGTIGIPKVVDWEWEFSVFVSLALIKPIKKLLNSSYLEQYFKSDFLKLQLSQRAKQGTVTNLHLEEIRELLIPVPEAFKEQTAIANALSDVDALLTELEKLIAKKQAIKTATMQQLLTGKTRLPQFATYTEGEKQGQPKGTKPSELGEIPEDWDVQTVYELAEGQKSLFDDGDWIEAEYITDKGVRLIQTGNIGVGSYQEKENKKYISESSFIKLKCKELKQGDLLICRLAEPAGRACIFPDIGEEKIITSVDVTIFRPPVETVNREYLLHYFSTNEWFSSVLEQVGGTTHKRISRGALGRIRVPMAKLAEQTTIATILSDMDNEIQTLEQRLAKTRQIKQGMMQELLTGRTRLPINERVEV